MKLTVLGSSGGAPTKRRNCTSFLLEEDPYYIMFDCAEGTQRQLLQAGCRMSRIKHIFISHLHFDHIGGLVPLLSTKSMFGIDSGITVTGPAGIKDFIEYNLKVAGSGLHFGLTVNEVCPGDVLDTGDFKVSVHELNHRLRSYGYRLVFRDRPGNLIKEKLAEYGIPEGPLCGRLKAGEEIVSPSGIRVSLQDVATPDKKGKVTAFTGDTYLCKGLYSCISEADLAVIESTFLEESKERAEERTHLTAKMAGNVAQRSGVRTLVLYHFSASHPDSSQFVNECREKFSGRIEAAEDLKIIEIE